LFPTLDTGVIVVGSLPMLALLNIPYNINENSYEIDGSSNQKYLVSPDYK